MIGPDRKQEYSDLLWSSSNIALARAAVSNPYFAVIERLATSATHLFEKFNHTSPDTGVGEGPGWFTSLWMLQESSLRPGMTICSRSWEVLTLHNSPYPLPVTLDSILVLWDLSGHSSIIPVWV